MITVRKTYIVCEDVLKREEEMKQSVLSLQKTESNVPVNDEDEQVIDLHEIQEARKPATINVILGCLSSFWGFGQQITILAGGILCE